MARLRWERDRAIMMAFDSAAEARGLFERVKLRLPSGDLESRSPIDGRVIGGVATAGAGGIPSTERARN
jgi:hypothetical protein